MAVEFEWRFDEEPPDRTPTEERSPRRHRWRFWLGLIGIVLLVGVGFYARWRARTAALAEVEAKVQAVAQLELRALAEGDTELYLSLQDDTLSTWKKAQEARAEAGILLPPPLPGLTATTALSVENARVVGDVARVEVVRLVGLPGGEMAPFRATRFYRRSDDGRWLHTRADRGYAGHTVTFAGERIEIVSYATDSGWIEPIASDLASLAERFCSLDGIVPCQHRTPLVLDFTGTLDTAVEPEDILPAPLVVGAPDDGVARAAWETGLRELFFDRLIVREVGRSLGSDRGWPRGGELFRAQLHEWLRADLGLSEPISPDLDLIGEALDAGEWIPLGALWTFTFADDDARRLLAEAEIDLLLAFIQEEYGRSQIGRPLHALRHAPRLEALIWQALGETWPAFEQRHAAYVREVTGRPFEPPGEAAAFAEYDLVTTCEGPSSLWGLRLDRPEMMPLLASADFGLHSWSPDGARLLVWREAIYGGGLYLLEADGSGVRQLTSIPEGAWLIGWSPDSSRVAYSTSGRSTAGEGLVNVEADMFAWCPDGSSVAYSTFGRPLQVGVVDVEADEGVVLAGRFLAWSHDGSRLAYVGEASFVWLAEGQGANPRWVEVGNPIAWSPDGTQIALFGLYSEPDLKIYDVTTEKTTLLLDAPALYDLLGLEFRRAFVSASSLAWSPTGEWIGFGVVQFDEIGPVKGGVALVRPDGNDLRLLLTREAGVAVTGWSPDGRWLTGIIYDRYDRAPLTTIVIGIDGAPLLETNGWGVWAPDGRYLAVVEPEGSLRILEVERGTWHSFEPAARCGPVVWNPRGPLHEPVPDGRDTTPP